MQNKSLVWLGVIFGIIFFVIGVVYVTHGAGSLPHYFPGYEIGIAKVHTKHAIAAFIAGVACFIVVWFSSAPKKNM